MEQVIKLVTPFFSTTRNYADILNRLASFAFYETYIITFLLRANAGIDNVLTTAESWGPIGKATSVIPHYEVVNLSGLVIAFVVAILTHTFQFHDRISDVLGIRRRFDRKNILMPLARRVGADVTKDMEVKIAKLRDELMHAVFYKYASSRDDKPLVDKHDIEHALNAWSWFWVFLEGIVYWTLAGIVAWAVASTSLALTFGAVSIVLILLVFVQRSRLGSYAWPQVETIAGDATAAHNVRKRFDAL